MNKIRFILILMFIYLFTVTGSIFSMPPHPDLLEKMREQGKLQQLMAGLNRMQERGMNAPPQNAAPTTGNIEALVILVNYSDTNMNAGSDIAFYENRLNGLGPLTTQQYFWDMSNNQLTLTCDVFGPYTIPNTLAYYGTDVGGAGNDEHPAELVTDAINAADSFVDFSLYASNELVIIIHAGRGQETGAPSNTIWSHMWNLNSAQLEIGDGGGAIIVDGVIVNTYTIQPEYVLNPLDSTIGVFTHELGHVFGLPDIYDTSNSTYGVGDWSLMASGSWNGPSGWGSVPAPLLAWERDILGWITLDTLVASNTVKTAVDYQYASFTILGIVLLLSLILTYIFGRKKGIKSIFIFLLPLMLVCFIPLSFVNCSDDSGGSASIINIDTSFTAQKIPLGYSYSGREQYYILENKVRTTGTWSDYLPGQGLLITHIDEYVLYGYGTYYNNKVCYYSSVHGINIIEADGDNALWYGFNQGSSTDPFYYGNNISFSSNSDPYTYYNKYSGGLSHTRVRSTVSITNISTPGNTMTFDYNY